MKYGLIGEKLGHSFSKEIHAMMGSYEYSLKEIPPDKLHEFMKKREFLGINVTIPYKEAVIPYLDWISDAAKEIGSVNTVINCDGRLYGYNTDHSGMIALFDHAGVDAMGKKAAILGSGGTAKTAYAALKSLGALEIIKVSRSSKGDSISYEDLYEKHGDIEIIVNTTPVGMYPNINSCPIDASKFSNLCGVIDAVYNPINTTLVQSAKSMKIAAEGGLYMLVAQAAVASELFLDENGNSATYYLNGYYQRIKGQKENIVLIGMPASGKSTVGKIIAESLGRKFIDTDDVITKRIGMPISEFIISEGEAKFRDIESEVIKELATKTSTVIATGGGAILRDCNITNLRYNGRLFFIDRPLGALVPTGDRPLSSNVNTMAKRYEERYPIYCAVCDERIDAECNADEVAKKILEKY